MLTDDRVIGILIAHLGAFGSGELRTLLLNIQLKLLKSSASFFLLA